MIKKIITGITLVCVILSLFGCYKNKDLITPRELVLNPDSKVIIAYAKDGKIYNFEESGGGTLEGKIIKGFIENDILKEIPLSSLVAVYIGHKDGDPDFFTVVMLGILDLLMLGVVFL